jgi:hypothetical protein
MNHLDHRKLEPILTLLFIIFIDMFFFLLFIFIGSTDFAYDGAITEKHDVLQEIGQYLLSSKHIFTLGQLMHLASDLKQYEYF